MTDEDRANGIRHARRHSGDAFAEAAFSLLLDALDVVIREKRKAKRPNIKASELAVAFEILAVGLFGWLAQAVVESWGIRSSADLGRLVNALVEVDMLRREKHDGEADFDELPDISNAIAVRSREALEAVRM